MQSAQPRVRYAVQGRAAVVKALLAALAMFVAFEGWGGAIAAPAAPPSLVFILCQVDDLTGTRPPPGTPGALVMPAPGWRDLELRVVDGEYQCKRVAVENIEDASLYSPKATADMIPLEPNFADHGQCARAGMMMSTELNKNGWAVVGVGCPTPIDLNGDGVPDAWKLPECPVYLPGTNNRMKCRFDESNV